MPPLREAREKGHLDKFISAHDCPRAASIRTATLEVLKAGYEPCLHPSS